MEKAHTTNQDCSFVWTFEATKGGMSVIVVSLLAVAIISALYAFDVGRMQSGSINSIPNSQFCQAAFILLGTLSLCQIIRMIKRSEVCLKKVQEKKVLTEICLEDTEIQETLKKEIRAEATAQANILFLSSTIEEEEIDLLPLPEAYVESEEDRMRQEKIDMLKRESEKKRELTQAFVRSYHALFSKREYLPEEPHPESQQLLSIQAETIASLRTAKALTEEQDLHSSPFPFLPSVTKPRGQAKAVHEHSLVQKSYSDQDIERLEKTLEVAQQNQKNLVISCYVSLQDQKMKDPRPRPPKDQSDLHIAGIRQQQAEAMIMALSPTPRNTDKEATGMAAPTDKEATGMAAPLPPPKRQDPIPYLQRYKGITPDKRRPRQPIKPPSESKK
jgi:hypothetical protein